MAKRQGLRRVDSEKVQGAGSYVKVRPIPYKDSRSAVNVGDDVTVGEKADMVTDLVVKSLVEWDWVDYDGEPFTLPTTTEEMAEILNTDEVNFLTRDLLGSTERSKN